MAASLFRWAISDSFNDTMLRTSGEEARHEKQTHEEQITSTFLLPHGIILAIDYSSLFGSNPNVPFEHSASAV